MSSSPHPWHGSDKPEGERRHTGIRPAVVAGVPSLAGTERETSTLPPGELDTPYDYDYGSEPSGRSSRSSITVVARCAWNRSAPSAVTRVLIAETNIRLLEPDSD